jgi:WD40 repeat protein/serine/threonine protein kinase
MVTCPSAQSLQAYLQGELDACSSEDIEVHAEHCKVCQATLAGLAVSSQESLRIATSPERGVADTRERIFTSLPTVKLLNLNANLPQIQGFEVLRVLGSGGIGVVYEALQLDLNRRVALKMLKPGVCDDETLARFQLEAETVAKLNHANIVKIFAQGSVDGRPYLALEMIDGGNLAGRLRHGPLAADVAAAIAEKAARGVHCAHQVGVVHRDLKPANILIERTGGSVREAATGSPTQDAVSGLTANCCVKVADFGLARRIDSTKDLTRTGMLMGTPTYMAPEQTNDSSIHVTPATDVHALGAILYEMLTGRPPFLGAGTVETLLTLVITDAVPPRRLNPGVPRDLETICLKCLQKAPGNRYPSAEALAEDLRRYLDGKPIVARPVGPLERVRKWAKRRPAAAALIVLILLVPLVWLPLVTVFWQDAVNAGAAAKTALAEKETQRQLAVAARVKTKEALDAEEKQRQLAESNLSSLRILLAHREWLSDHVEQAERLLDQCPLGHRPWEWHYVKRLCHKELLTLQGHTGAVHAVAYSPDGKRLASGGRHIEVNGNVGQVKIWDMDSGQELLALDGHEAPVRAVAYSPDGLHLASADERGMIRLWDAASGALRRTFKGHAGFVYSLAFHPNNSQLVSGGADNLVRVWDVATAAECFSFRETAGPILRVNAVAYSPTGDHIATSGGSKFIKLWDAATGKLQFQMGPHLSEVQAIAFRPDGQQIASASDDKTVRIWDPKTKSLVQVLRGHTRGVETVIYAPDGKSIISGAMDGGLGELKIWDPIAGEEKYSLRGHREGIRSLAVRRDGLRLVSASADMSIKIWDPNTDSEADTLRNIGPSFSFSPDRKHLAAISVANKAGRRIKIWDVKTLEPVAEFDTDFVAAHNIAYSHDGNKIAAACGGQIRILDLPSRKSTYHVASTKNGGVDVCFSPDDAFLAISVNNERNVKVCDAITCNLRQTLPGHFGRTESVRYHPDGKLILTAGANEAKLWNAADGTLLRILAGHDGPVQEAVFSTDGTRIATASHDRTARIWATDTGELLNILPGHGHFVVAVAFSPDGQRLATSDNEGVVKLWNAQTGQVVLTLQKKFSEGLPGVIARPRRISFSPDGHRLAAWYSDSTLRILNATPVNDRNETKPK